MNCKPGDLAVVITTSRAGVNVPSEIVGAVVTVTELHDTRVAPVWIVKEPFVWTPTRDYRNVLGPTPAGVPHWVCAIPDAVLQPIRGLPDGDARTVARPVSDAVGIA